MYRYKFRLSQLHRVTVAKSIRLTCSSVHHKIDLFVSKEKQKHKQDIHIYFAINHKNAYLWKFLDAFLVVGSTSQPTHRKHFHVFIFLRDSSHIQCDNNKNSCNIVASFYAPFPLRAKCWWRGGGEEKTLWNKNLNKFHAFVYSNKSGYCLTWFLAG